METKEATCKQCGRRSSSSMRLSWVRILEIHLDLPVAYRHQPCYRFLFPMEQRVPSRSSPGGSKTLMVWSRHWETTKMGSVWVRVSSVDQPVGRPYNGSAKGPIDVPAVKVNQPATNQPASLPFNESAGCWLASLNAHHSVPSWNSRWRSNFRDLVSYRSFCRWNVI